MILGFDTSANHVGAALFAGSDVIAAQHEEMARGQAERLMPMIQEVLSEGGASLQDLTAIGVGVGPGNFTGIRLSVSAARGLALGLGIPAVGVTLLEAMAFAGTGPRLSCQTAPRGQAYVQGFDTDAEIAPQLIAVADMPKIWAQSGITCLGSAREAVAEHLGTGFAPAAFAPASAIARIAALRWRDNPPRPTPLYLKPADAAPSRDAPPVILDGA